MKVEYIDHMGSDLSTVNSARVSFDRESDYFHAGTDLNGKDVFVLADKDIKLIKYLADHKHMTPFRHNQIQLRCHAPIFLARQLGKHQAGLSWNEVSRRYVDTPPEFYVPDVWRSRPNGSVKQGSAGPVSDYAQHFMNEQYDRLLDHATTLYRDALEQGVSPEMARMVLPQSMMTSWYWTGNLLAFAHVYKERVAEGAQYEARVFAIELDKIIRPLFPVSWAALVDA